MVSLKKSFNNAQIYTIHVYLISVKTFIKVFDFFVPLGDTDELWFNNAQIYTQTFNSCAVS